MEQSEMEVDSSEIALTNKDESCLEVKSLCEESPAIDPSSPVEPSSQIVPSSQTTSQAVEPNQESCPPAAPSNEIVSSEAAPSDQTTSQVVSPDQAALPSEMPPPQVVPSAEKPSSEAEPSQVVTSLPGPSSEAVPLSIPSKLTNGPATKKQRIDYHSMSTGVYLDSTVVPILHLALVTLDRLRPADPVQYVIDFLLRHKSQYSKPKEQPAPNSSANQA